MTPVVGLVLAVALGFGIRHLRGRRAAEQRAAVDAGLGFTVDLVAVVVGSGGTVRQAAEAVAQHGPSGVCAAFALAIERARTTMLLADALDSVAVELGPVFHPLLGALVATERDGAPISLLLQRLADDAEQARRWQTDALATRLPVTMLVPLVTCLLPATVVGALVPLALVALRNLNIDL